MASVVADVSVVTACLLEAEVTTDVVVAVVVDVSSVVTSVVDR